MSKPLLRRFPPQWVYILLSLTWGLPLTLMGAAIHAVLRLRGYESKRFGHCRYIEVGERWGGLEGGLFFITCRAPSERLLRHEHGHGLQNLVFGPLMLPCVTIPSAIRWHWRHHIERKQSRLRVKYASQTESLPPRSQHALRPLPPYSSIWFERQADELGGIVEPIGIDELGVLSEHAKHEKTLSDRSHSS